MEFVTKPGDTMVLEDGESFLVVKCLEYNGEGYLYLCGGISNLGELFDKNVKKTTFVKEVIENEELFIEEILDEKLLKELVKLVKNDDIFED